MSQPQKKHFTAVHRRTLLKGGSAALLFGVWNLAWGSDIVAVRIWPAADYTRVTIESARPLQTTQRMVQSPPRLAVDIQGLQLDSTLRDLVAKVRPDDPNIADIRVGQFTPDVVRLVIDLKQPIRPEVFSLKPVAAYQNRLVFDLYPVNPPDPLAQLIASVSGPAGSAPTTVASAPAAPRSSVPFTPKTVPSENRDALGDLIAQQIERANGNPEPTGPATASRPPIPARSRPTAPLAPPAVASGTRRLIIVAVDAGHGGEDPGATGPGGTHEKDVTLAIAFKLRDLINRSSVNGDPMRCFLTRDGDYFVPLAQRVEKARRVHADLFMSIHADSAPGGNATGTSVYALSERGASSTTASWLAKSENDSDLIGGVNLADRGTAIQRTLLDMSTTAQIKDSLIFGRAMLGSIKTIGPLRKAQVERANFAVLRDPDVPSILVETAFINNPVEEVKLRSPSFQSEMAQAMMDGILKYFAAHPPLARSGQI
jgi:N-acetylmuramoyl-L-alanine amidase